MKQGKIFFLMAGILFLSFQVNAQIFINTGNPNLKKYREENPGAVLWETDKNYTDSVIPAAKKTEAAPIVEKKTEKRIVQEPVAKKEPVKQEQNIPEAKTASKAGGPPVDYPENAEPGKCYARCYVADQYEYQEEQVVDVPAHVKVEKIPAKYETVLDTIIVKPATTKTVAVPAVYETVMEEVLVTPAGKKWVKGKADKNCLSRDPKDCEVWCMYEIPAVYKKVPKKIEKAAATTREEPVPAVIKVMPRKKLLEPESENKIEIPATYKTVSKKVLVKKGGYEEWKEVLCEAYVTDAKISAIQKALIREGYDPGPADNQMGPKTKDALVKFQQDKGLPVGNLNMETLKALGVQ